jgi:class 3 adenylate cyclase
MSHCPACGASITPDLRFCLACGHALSTGDCPSCGAPRAPGARFCGRCGTRLDESTETGTLADPRVAQEGTADGGRLTERRLVSVLFADLVGFTSASEHEDPESVREFLSAYFERATEIVGRYGGTVEKFIGDAVMTVWGTPTAHEDDAERAVRAAFDFQAMVGTLERPAQLRVAVMTGEAAVSPGSQGQGLVAGDLVNTTSRLQAAATPGAVFVDETTMRAAGRAIAFESAGDIQLKGKAGPVHAWRALRVVAERGGIGRRDVLEPPFVGRDEDLRLLKDSLHAIGRDGRARLVTLVGHAGLGKSRLAWELRKYTDGLTETIYWHEGQSPAYGEGVVYWALGEMVRGRCRIGLADDATTVRARLAEALLAFVPEPEERAWIELRLAALLGVAEAPAGDREELFAAWRTFLERIADRGTVVLMFEDLHWADESMLEFIDHLLDWSREHPIFVVGLARPELLERRPGWGSAHRSATTVHLEPLSEAAISALLEGLVPGLPETIHERIVERAEGIPLYAVETVRMLLDEGSLVSDGERYRLLDPDAPVAVPASLQALVAARLDALDPALRGLVTDASILGKSFSAAALAAVSGRPAAEVDGLVTTLVRKEVVTLGRARVGGQAGEYEFVQSLLREVAYSTLARRDRQSRHMAAASHYASLADEELAGLVASHYLEAYRAAPDSPAGEVAADRARMALRTAAERSVALHAHPSALRFIEEALTVTSDPEERAQLWVMATLPAWSSTDMEVAERYIRQAADWYVSNGRDLEADEAVALMADMFMISSRIADVGPIVEPRVDLIDDAHPRPTAPRLLNELARWLLFNGEASAALVSIDRGLAIAERLIEEPAMATLFATKSWAMGLSGRHRESIALGAAGLQLAERHGLVTVQFRARMNLSDLYTGIDPIRAAGVARDGVALAQRVGHATWAAALACNESLAALLLGEWRTPIQREEELDRPFVAPGSRAYLGSIASVGRAYLGLPGPSVAEQALRAETAREPSNQLESMATSLRAFEAYASGDLNAVDELALASARGTAHFTESAIGACLAVHALTWLGERRRLERSVEHLEALGWATDVRAATIRQAKAALTAMRGDHDEAEIGYRATLSVWRALGMRPDVVTAELEMLRLLGDRLADREALASDARAIATELGAVTLLQRLDEVASASERVEVGT